MTTVTRRPRASIKPAQRDMLERLNSEAAKIHWSELARFFAAGKTIYVAAGQDLLRVASAAIADEHGAIRQWMEEGSVQLVTDAQAQRWFEDDARVWALVIAPWVLVQEDTMH